MPEWLNADRGLLVPALRGLSILSLRLLARRPGETLGAIAVVLGGGLIAVNAVLLQHGPHPSPLGQVAGPPLAAPTPPDRAATGSVPHPVARPAGLGAVSAALAEPPAPPRRTRAQIVADVQRELGRRGYYDGTVDGVLGPRTDAAIRDVEQALGWRPTGEATEALVAAIRRLDARSVPRPPATVAGSGQVRIAAVQRALSELGYGQLRADGRPTAEMRAAIQRFERSRNLPVTGEVSDRIVRELASVTGSPIE